MIKSLSDLKDASNLASFKSTLKHFFEGMKAVASDNSRLQNEVKEKNSKISALEAQVKILMEEKVDLANSIEFNAAAIKELQDKSTTDQKKLEAQVNYQKEFSTQITQLEDKIDATEAYERRDTVILSGDVPPVSPNEDIRQKTVDLIQAKYRTLKISPVDISVCHRLQPKRPSQNGSQKPPNIYVKFVRRDTKREVIKASKEQARDSQHKVFANESLTPKRTAILQTLLKIKRSNNILKGVTTEEGQIIAFTAPRAGSNGTPDAHGRVKDQRHCITTKEQLQGFCDLFLRRPLEELLDSWPPSRRD